MRACLHLCQDFCHTGLPLHKQFLTLTVRPLHKQLLTLTVPSIPWVQQWSHFLSGCWFAPGQSQGSSAGAAVCSTWQRRSACCGSSALCHTSHAAVHQSRLVENKMSTLRNNNHQRLLNSLLAVLQCFSTNMKIVTTVRQTICLSLCQNLYFFLFCFFFLLFLGGWGDYNCDKCQTLKECGNRRNLHIHIEKRSQWCQKITMVSNGWNNKICSRQTRSHIPYYFLFWLFSTHTTAPHTRSWNLNSQLANQ